MAKIVPLNHPGEILREWIENQAIGTAQDPASPQSLRDRTHGAIKLRSTGS